DVFDVAQPAPLRAESVLDVPNGLGQGGTVVIVAASGGGIVASAWTTTVLQELRKADANFDRELRLISSVSGGSVGAAYYLSALERGSDRVDIASVVDASETGSLEASS